MRLIKRLFFFFLNFIFLLQLSCNSDLNNNQILEDNNENKTEDIETTQQNNDCIGMPNCNDKEGLEVEWSPGVTNEIIKRTSFLKQIPNNYTGYLKLCGENGMYRYISCKNGKIDGISYDYSCDGGYDEQYFKNSIAEGTWIHYNSSGQYDFVRNFKNGLLHGEYKRYHQNLELWVDENYYEGKLDGTSKTYYLSGNIQKQEQYSKGVIISSKSFYENGQLESEKLYEKGIEKKWVIYDEYGNIISNMKERPHVNINRP
jgi:antitoxin component YwqK of YwqJK toxin-antitoxin module